jgi:hypothetical protein
VVYQVDQVVVLEPMLVLVQQIEERVEPNHLEILVAEELAAVAVLAAAAAVLVDQEEVQQVLEEMVLPISQIGQMQHLLA